MGFILERMMIMMMMMRVGGGRRGLMMRGLGREGDYVCPAGIGWGGGGRASRRQD